MSRDHINPRPRQRDNSPLGLKSRQDGTPHPVQDMEAADHYTEQDTPDGTVLNLPNGSSVRVEVLEPSASGSSRYLDRDSGKVLTIHRKGDQ